MLEQFSLLITYMLIFAVALMFVALGGMYSERSGVINIGLEGIMVVGGFAGLLTLNSLSSTECPPALIVILCFLVSIVAGMLYSLLLAVVSIQFKADQTLAGTALNLLATALSVILCKKLTGGVATAINFRFDFFVWRITEEFHLFIFLPIGIVVLLIGWFVLYKTRFGLRLRSCGEHPQAADSVGINVKKYRYLGVLISGALGGLGGLAYIIPESTSWNSTSGVAGFGFLALAIMIFGQWKPIRIGVISLLFSFFLALSYIYSGVFRALFGYTLTSQDGVTPELFRMIPFIMSLILLAFTSRKSRAPKAEGIPYDKSQR